MTADTLSTTFAALADPTRRAILESLMAGEKNVSELAQPFAMTMPAVTKHLKVLENAKLVERGRSAQFRPCRLHAAPLRDAQKWIGRYRRFFEESFDRLDEFLAQEKEERKEDE